MIAKALGGETDVRIELKKDLITHLSSEVATYSTSALTFRTRSAFTIWIGPYLLLGSILIATEAPVSFECTAWVIAALLVYVALGVVSGWIERHYWRKCNDARELIVELTTEKGGERDRVLELMIDHQTGRLFTLLGGYALVFGMIAFSFVAVGVVVSRLQ